MFDFEALEKKCKKYRRRKYLYLSIAFIVITIFIYGGYKLYFYKEKSSNAHVKNIENIVDKNKNQNKKAFKAKVNKILVKKDSKEKKQTTQNRGCFALQFLTSTKKYIYFVNSKKRYLEKLGFDCYIKESIQDENKIYLRCNIVPIRENLKKFIKLAEKNRLSFFVVNEECGYSKIKKQEIKKEKSKIVVKNEKNVSSVKKLSNLKSKTKEKKSVQSSFLQLKPTTIKELEKLFNQKKTYDLAIKISEKYFEKKDFKNSLKWAKIANNINNEDEKSWILYAKSLYSLGDKKSAIEILKVFLQYKSSQTATRLLNKWIEK